MPTDRVANEPPDAIQAWLELRLDTEPIEGTLTIPGAAANPFVGWIGLTAAIEGLRSPGRPSKGRLPR
ncbi:MAG: hypothetical protein WD770_00820 [Actinomycetota bacterium]